MEYNMHTATSSLQMYFSRIGSLQSQTYLCSNYKSHYEDQLFTNSVFTLYCIVFVPYLNCICIVFVLYLYCICTLFVFVLYLWSNYGSHNVGRLHHPIMGHNRRHTSTGPQPVVIPIVYFVWSKISCPHLFISSGSSGQSVGGSVSDSFRFQR